MTSSIFKWKQGAGWLVISGGGDFLSGVTEDVDMRMLTMSAADGALAYIGAAHDQETAEQFLNYVTDLGGRAGYSIDIIAEDDQTLTEQLSEAGVIVIGDGHARERLYNGLHGAAMAAIQTAYQRGSLVMGIGFGAEVFGQWVFRATDQFPQAGFEWLENAAIFTAYPNQQEKQALQRLLHSNPLAYGLQIGSGSALAFGPEGRVALWGEQQISISLGQGYSVKD